MQASGAALAASSSAKILFGKYELGRLLGVGAFAKVYYGRHIVLGESVAIKVLSKAKVLRVGLVAHTKREIAVMGRLHHPHIVRLIEVLASRSNVYFVMEYAKGGELFSRVARGRLPEDQSRHYFHQLISAVAFCHAHGVFHRDLKPENLLLDDSGNLKVSDFGLSTVADQTRSDGLFHTLCGTPAYVAPEILSRKGYEGAKVDIWSCGVILFVLIAGYLPFNDPNLMALYRKIYHGDYRCPRWISPELRLLLSKLLDVNPDTRITVQGILNDPWFTTGMPQRNTTLRLDLSRVDEEEDRDINAFDIISLYSKFNLSGFFDQTAEMQRHRFVSVGSVGAVLDRLESVGREEGLAVRRKRWNGMSRGSAVVEGWMGCFIARVELYRLSLELVMVEVERSGVGLEAARCTAEFWRERLAGVFKSSISEPHTPVAGGEPGGVASTLAAGGANSEPVSPVCITQNMMLEDQILNHS